MAYKVKLDMFEGPFDLLVYLIEHSKMSIYDIRVSEITRQYLDYVAQLQKQKQDANVGGDFMVLAAELIELKSKMLLPRQKVEDGFLEEEDPRNDLVQKILEYKRFKKASEEFEQREEFYRGVYAKPQEDLAPYTREPDEFLNMDLNQFVKAFHLFLMKKKKLEEVKRTYENMERQRMTIETRIEQIKDFFKDKKRGTFRELVGEATSNDTIVLTFMSLLELLKQRTMNASQKIRYGEIVVSLVEEEEGMQHDK